MVIALLLHSRKDQSSPHPDVLFIQERPGANGRHVTFTPVLRADPSVKVVSVAGADYGWIQFEDVDGNGIQETIVEIRLPLIYTGEFYSDTREILRYIPGGNGMPRMESIGFEKRGQGEW